MKISLKKNRAVFQSLKHFRFNSMFYKIFIVTLSILLAVAVLNYVAIIYIRNSLTQNEIKAQRVYLENNSLYIDNVMNNIKNFTYSIQSDNNVRLLTYMEDMDNYYNYRMVNDTVKKLRLFKITLKEVNNVYIYIHKMNRIIDISGINSTRIYYMNRYNGDFNTWSSFLEQKHWFSIQKWKNDLRKDSGFITSTLNITSTLMDNNMILGTVVINIDEEFIGKLLTNNEFSKGRSIYMTDGDGKVISSNVPSAAGMALDIDFKAIYAKGEGCYFRSDGQLVTYKKSAANNLYYIIYTPKEIFLSQVTKLYHIANVIIAVFLAAGIVIAFFVSQFLYSPIGNIVDFFNAYSIMTSDRDINKNEMDFIRNRAASMISVNQRLEKTVKESVPLIIDIVLLKIIMGGQEINNAITIMSQYDIAFAEGLYMTAVIRIDKLPGDETTWQKQYAAQLRSIIKVYLEAYLLSIIKTGESEYTVLTVFDRLEVKDSIKLGFTRAHEELTRLWSDISIYIGTGQPMNDIFEINKSYKQALKALDYRPVKEMGRVFDYRYEKSYEKPVIPCDMEQRLLNTITSGSMDMSARYINDILKGNYDRNVAFISYYNVCVCINNLLKRIIYDWAFDKNSFDKEVLENITEIEYVMDLERLSIRVVNNVSAIVEYYAAKKRGKSSMEKIIEYIDNNFNKDINLETVADKFCFNPNYLSRCFKQAKGVSFTDYMNYKKNEMAKELLVNTRKTVKEIAQESGYSNVNIFIRAFEKLEGVTPGEYRKRAQSV